MKHEGCHRSLQWPQPAIPARPVVQMRREFWTNNQKFVVENSSFRPVGHDGLFDIFTDLTNLQTANFMLGPSGKYKPDGEQARWLYFALKFLRDNQAQLVGVNLKQAMATLFRVVCEGQIRARAVSLTSELNFGREVLRLVGYRRTYLAARLAAPKDPSALEQYFERDDKPNTTVDLDEGLLRGQLETDIVALMKAHDPRAYVSIRLRRDPLGTAKAVHRFARKHFRPYIAAIETLPVTISAPLADRVSLLEEEFTDARRVGLLANRAEELDLLTAAHYNSNRQRDEQVLEDILGDVLKRRKDVQDLVDRHLRVTPRAGHTQKFVKLQRDFQRDKAHTEKQARAHAQWQRIGSISHELMHFYCHHDFEKKSSSVKFGQVITEGFTELLGLELYDALRQQVINNADTDLIKDLRAGAAADEFKQAANHGSRQGYVKALNRASDIQTRVGKPNVRAAYFLGKPELIGLA